MRSGVSGVRHHAAFHPFFSRARSSVDAVGRRVLLHLCSRVGGPCGWCWTIRSAAN